MQVNYDEDSASTKTFQILQKKLSLQRELEAKVNELTCIDEKHAQHFNNSIQKDEIISKKWREREADNYKIKKILRTLRTQ